MPIDPEDLADVHRASLLRATFLFEFALLAVALAAIWLLGVSPAMGWGPTSLAIGIAAGIALAVIVIPLAEASEFLFERIQRDMKLFIRLFKKCSITELVLIGLLAGVCEEAFFRGFMQQWFLSFWEPHVAILVASVLFGLAHAISIPYTVFATVLGVVLGYLYHYTESLPAAMLAHAVYDMIALYYATRVLDLGKAGGAG